MTSVPIFIYSNYGNAITEYVKHIIEWFESNHQREIEYDDTFIVDPHSNKLILRLYDVTDDVICFCEVYEDGQAKHKIYYGYQYQFMEYLKTLDRKRKINLI
jgi:hypothetical protein